jgi:ferredoxin
MGTAFLLLSILFGATLMGVLYKGQAWCRYVCPLGKIIGAGATMSMVELRADLDTCRSCGKFACKRGREDLHGCPIYLGAHNIKNNLDCLLCGRCVLLCQNESPRLLLRNPFVELVSGKSHDLTYSFIIPFLAGSQWARYIHERSWYRAIESGLPVSKEISFLALLVLCYALFLLIIRFGNFLIGRLAGDQADHGSPMIPILIPLAFSGELVYRLKYLLVEAGRFPAVFGRQFGFDLERFTFSVSAQTVEVMVVVLIVLGGLGSLYATRLFAQKSMKRTVANPLYRMVQLVVGSVFCVYLLLNFS